MPKKKPHPCSYVSCMLLTEERYCEEHKKLHANNRPVRSPKIKSRQRMYKRRGWQILRSFVLVNEPLCRDCGKFATVVDHIVPHRGNERLFNDDANLQPLCKKCHDIKTGQGL